MASLVVLGDLGDLVEDPSHSETVWRQPLTVYPNRRKHPLISGRHSPVRGQTSPSRRTYAPVAGTPVRTLPRVPACTAFSLFASARSEPVVVRTIATSGVFGTSNSKPVPRKTRGGAGR